MFQRQQPNKKKKRRKAPIRWFQQLVSSITWHYFFHSYSNVWWYLLSCRICLSIIIISRKKICEWKYKNWEYKMKRKKKYANKQTHYGLKFSSDCLHCESNSFEECLHFRCCCFNAFWLQQLSHGPYIIISSLKYVICFYSHLFYTVLYIYIQFRHHQSVHFCSLWLRLIWIFSHIRLARFIYIFQIFFFFDSGRSNKTISLVLLPKQHNQF